MTLLQIIPEMDGSHLYQVSSVDLDTIPDDMVLVPENMLPLDNFPYGNIKFKNIDGVQTLTEWTPLPIPIPPEPIPEPSMEEKLQAQVLYTAVETGTLLIEGGPNT